MARNPKIDQCAIDKQVEEIAKGYERSPKTRIRLPVETEATGTGSLIPLHNMGIENDRYLARLLVWLDDLAALQPAHYVDVTRFVD